MSDIEISATASDGDGTLVAGLDGFTWGGYAYVDLLGVSDALAGQGVGRRLANP